MKEIKLTQGKVALVDDEDYEYLNQFNWYAKKDRHTYYAARQIKTSVGKQNMLFMHRVLLGLTDIKIEGEHIDHDGLNNQKYNLRKATRSQNNANKSSSKNSTSKYLGVCWAKSNKKWCAKIRKDKVVTHLGFFINEVDAALAYNNAARKLHGDFANINQI
jgi:hypothetical protein